jgi:hypothetical protein
MPLSEFKPGQASLRSIASVISLCAIIITRAVLP